jgi:sn-glycerol 3-phosphate transport system substrate-binding protein
VTGYYSTVDGKMLSLPFNSSTPVVYWNKAEFKKAGLDPDKAPATWPETFAAAKKLRAAGNNCGFTSAWVSWIQIENFSAWHNIAIGTKANGLGGVDTELEINNPLVVRHVNDLVEAQKDKSFDYKGRETQPESSFLNGDCGMMQDSSAAYGLIKKTLNDGFGVAELPYYPDVKGAPQNSIIGGASLWVMGGKTAEEYKGVAKFLSFLSDTDRQVWLHKTTGYLPITRAAYDKAKDEGFYKDQPYLETPLKELTNKEPTENSRGLRLGNMVQLRDLWSEEIEQALAGKKTAKEALDAATEKGNAMLRQFEKTAVR